MLEVKSKKKVYKTKNDLLLLANEINLQKDLVPVVECKITSLLEPNKFNLQASIDIRDYLNALNDYYQKTFDAADKRKNNKLNYLNQNKPAVYKRFYDNYFNEHLADQMKNAFEKAKNYLLESDHHLVQQIDPIYLDPRIGGRFDFRAHLYAPRKHFLGHFYDTFLFNVFILWAFTVLFYLALYFELLKKLFDLPEKIKMRRK